MHLACRDSNPLKRIVTRRTRSAVPALRAWTQAQQTDVAGHSSDSLTLRISELRRQTASGKRQAARQDSLPSAPFC